MAVWRFGFVKVCAALALAAPVAAQAACARANASKLNTYDDNAAKIRFDKVNLNDILWTCDVADVQAGNAYFLIATNGDDISGGYYNMPCSKPNIYATWFSRASCVVRNNTPVVNFLPMSVAQLMNGETTDQNFVVEIECNKNVAGGTGNNQTAIGIQVSPAAHHHAVETSSPPLRNNQDGITHLIADDYDQPGTAMGVGVTLWQGNTRWNFLAQPAWTGAGNPGGNDAGWYGATQAGATLIKTEGDYHTWQHDFTARFGRVSTLQVTPGHFTATATVLVKVQ